MKNGCFVISLDFELFWGILDSVNYKENLDRILLTRDIVTDLITFFEKNKINVTWSTVGLLMLKSEYEFNNLKSQIVSPIYDNQKYNNYISFNELSKQGLVCEEVFFANSLINQLKTTKYQYIGTHTFSHYYCLEPGQTETDFENDIKLAKYIAKKNEVEIKSIVFPRNQFLRNYLNVLYDQEINIFRGNPDHYIYEARNKSNYFIRALRLIDTYINIVGQITHNHTKIEDGLFNVKASRFLRPLNNTPKILKKLQLRRIKKEMTTAAKKINIIIYGGIPITSRAHLKKILNFLKR